MIVAKNIREEIRNRMEQRLKSVYSAIAICLSYDHDGYFVAGNSCNAAAPHDFDIYPNDGHIFNFLEVKSRIESVGGYVVCETRNALTVNIGGKVIQFCNYGKPNLISLIESFDFAHIQIGVAVKIEWRPGNFKDDLGGYGSSTICDVEFTDDWQKAHLLETTWYTGSEYPLSSLIRLSKYLQRGCYAKKHEYKKDVLRILNDIISCGYEDYEDYKDQLAAIDLLLLEPEEKEAAWSLFLTCGGRGLVKAFTAHELEENDGRHSSV